MLFIMAFNEYLGKLDDIVRIYDNLLKEFGFYNRTLMFDL